MTTFFERFAKCFVESSVFGKLGFMFGKQGFVFGKPWFVFGHKKQNILQNIWKYSKKSSIKFLKLSYIFYIFYFLNKLSCVALENEKETQKKQPRFWFTPDVQREHPKPLLVSHPQNSRAAPRPCWHGSLDGLLPSPLWRGQLPTIASSGACILHATNMSTS